MKVTSATIALLMVLAPVVAGVPAVVVGADGGELAGATGVPEASQTNVGASQADNASNTSMGASISSFMQASEADANASVDTGMFEAKFERTEANNRPELVQKRTEQLEARLEQLRNEREELIESTDDGELTVAERAKVARLTARIQGLKRAIEQTENVARAIGVDPAGLTEVSKEAKNMTGPPEVKTGLKDIDRGVGPPEDRPGNVNPGDEGNGGPPDDSGNQSDEGNESDGSDESSNQSDDRGNADNRSQGNDKGNESGGPDERGDRNSSDGNERGNGSDRGDRGNQSADSEDNENEGASGDHPMI